MGVTIDRNRSKKGKEYRGKIKCGRAAISTALIALVLAGCNTNIKEPEKEKTLPPTPTPTETPGEIPSATAEIPNVEIEPTEAEKMFDFWIENAKRAKRDVYANLVATKAYYAGELDTLIETGKYTDEDIQLLKESNHVIKNSYYHVTDNIIADDYNVNDLTPAELVIAILRGDDIKTTSEALNETFHAFDWLLSMGYSLLSVLPEESRDAVYELTDIVDKIEGKDVAEFDEKINSSDLDWRQKWYVIQYCVARPGISPKVIYNGEETQFVKYIYDTNLAGDFVLQLQEIFENSYLANENDNVEFFKVR